MWNGNQSYNEARQRLTNATFNLMASHKGIGVNEISETCSYYEKIVVIHGDGYQVIQNLAF